MKAPRRMAKGVGRVLAAPVLVVSVWLANLLVALPAAVVVGEGLGDAIGKSEAGERLLEGFDFGWHGETKAEAGALVGTLDPARLVTGGWIDNLDRWWSGQLFQHSAPILAFGALFALVWILLSGGVLSHLHRPPRRFTLAGFAGDGAGFFFRFFRLALLSAPLYYGIFRLARWLFARIERATMDLTVERTLLIYYLLAAALVVLLVVTVKMIFDYARVAIVVAERRSALLAVFAGLGFVLRRPLATYGLLALFGLAAIALVAARQLVVPGVDQDSWLAITGVFLLGQAFLVARLVLRLGLLAGELTLYEEEKR